MSSSVGILHNAVLDEDQFGAMGGGAAWFDHDSDGFLDLYLTGFEGPDKLYRNKGDGTFMDISVTSGIAALSSGWKTTGIVTGDIDNDGDRDLLVTTGPESHNRLFLHNSDNTYTDVSQTAGILDTAYSFSAAMGDYDLDGNLDIYVTNWVKAWDTNASNPEIMHSAWPDMLYHNNGDGTFTNVAHQFGLDDTLGCGLAVAFTDSDLDHDQDILVVNDFGQFGNSENRLWANQHPSSGFTDNAPIVGLHAGLHGMGIAIGDLNEDGQLDYYATNMGANVLHVSSGNGSYNEVAAIDGVEDAMQGMAPSVGWGCTFLDMDNDSDLDLSVSNGMLILGSINPNTSRMFLNDGAGSFIEIGDICGVSDDAVNRGLAQADYDNDGDIDLLMVRMDTSTSAPSVLYKNLGGSGNNWLKVSLQGVHNNRDGYGAKVYLQIGNRILMREINGGSSYCSQNSSIAHFGLGATSAIDSLWVVWPSGYSQSVLSPAVNQQITVIEDQLVGDLQPANADINIYPTVFTNSVFVKSDSPIIGVELFDELGRLAEIQTANGSLTTEITVRDQGSGIFTLRIRTEDGRSFTRKVVKQ